MPDVQRIKTVMERNTRAVSLKPSVGQSTQAMHVDMDETGSCHVADDDTSLIVDMGEAYGGKGTTPSPGFYVRAALGSCIAQGYLCFAATMDIPINRLSVDLEFDSDMRGNLGIDPDVPTSYTAVRYVVNIDSPAPADRIEALADVIDKQDWVLDVFKRAIPVTRELRVTDSASAA
ncbi:MAG: OsmC family protein [Rhodovibrionaceae bacterium]|nr:OsmC family protein [Rhodovibrionaceae bacterium]